MPVLFVCMCILFVNPKGWRSSSSSSSSSLNVILTESQCFDLTTTSSFHRAGQLVLACCRRCLFRCCFCATTALLNSVSLGHASHAVQTWRAKSLRWFGWCSGDRSKGGVTATLNYQFSLCRVCLHAYSAPHEAVFAGPKSVSRSGRGGWTLASKSSARCRMWTATRSWELLAGLLLMNSRRSMAKHSEAISGLLELSICFSLR